MENRWTTIVKNLRRSKLKNVDEDTYQDTIECQLQLLGWFDGIETRPSLPNGAAKTLIPDIVLNKDNHRVLPIEIKRPNNTFSERQACQLSSYMRRLRLSIGVYIGENIQLYYDTPEDDYDAISVCTIELEENNPLGRKICQLLTYDNFDTKTFEDFCIEQLRMKNARNDFRKRIQEYVSPQSATQNIIELLKEKFLTEGFDSIIIDTELKKLSFIINYNANNIQIPFSKQAILEKVTKNSCLKTLPSSAPSVAMLQEKSDKMFFIRTRKGIDAKAIYRDGRMIVLKGSIFTPIVSSSFKAHATRNMAIKKSEKMSSGYYCLLEDFSFDSPSAASQVMCGASSNGWIAWKTENGKTLKEYVEHNL